MDDDLKLLGLAVKTIPDVDNLSKETILEMYETLRAAFIEIHEINAQIEFPKEGIESRLARTIALVQGTTADMNKVREDRNRLKNEFGEPASSKLRRLREYICSIAPDLMHDN